MSNTDRATNTFSRDEPLDGGTLIAGSDANEGSDGKAELGLREAPPVSLDPSDGAQASADNKSDPSELETESLEPLPEPDVAPSSSASLSQPAAPRHGRGLPLVPVLLAASVFVGALLARHLRRRRNSCPKAPPEAKAAEASIAEVPPSPEPEPVDPDSLQIIVCGPPASPSATVPTTGSLPRSLAGVTFVVSEDVDLEGTPTTLGAPEATLAAPASSSCPAILQLQEAGAICVGKVALQPLGLDTIGANFGNPYNKANVSGGAQTGSAAAVSTGIAQAALCSDLLGSARVPAACCGVYCYSSSPGAVGHVRPAAAAAAAGAGGGSTGPPLEALSLMAADPAVMLKAAQALKAPGSFDLRGELVRFVVAEDLFATCAVEYQPAGLAIKRAILKWAGSEQAGAVQLCRFLSDNSAGWQSLTPDELLGAISGLPPGLPAWATAGRILQAAELHAALPHLAEAPQQQPTPPAPEQPQEEKQGEERHTGADADAATEAEEEQGASADGAQASAMREEQASGLAGADDEAAMTPGDGAGDGLDGNAGAGINGGDGSAGDEGEAGPVGEVAQQPAEAADAAGTPGAPRLRLPPLPPAERVAAAQSAARELYDTLRHTVKPDTVIVLPVAPTAPMRRRAAAAAAATASGEGGDVGAGALEAKAWEALVHCFNCLATLAQCPVVVVPLGTVADGTPLAAALMGCSRFDARLLAVAAKIGPIMQEAFEAVKEDLAKAVRKQNEQLQAPPPAAGAAAAAPPQAAGGRGAAAAAAAPPPSPSAAAAAPAAPAVVDQRRLDRAERFKARGNELFRAGKFAEALGEYSRAINEHPDNAVYYNNRAMACLKIFRFEQAEEDCNRALKFDLKEADKAKALLRRATARTALQKYPEAERDLRQVLAVEPNNRQAREDLQNLQQMKADMAAAQQRMAAEFQAQRRMAAGATPGAPPAGGPGSGGDGGPGGFPGFPPGLDPSALPPGIDWSQLAAAAGGPEALMNMMGGGPGGLEGFGPMFGGGGGSGRGR